jgi:leucyl-tRNA synthetase
MILGSDNEKMSKSRGNVVNPDDVVEEYGADTMRLYEMRLGAFDQATAWQESGVQGTNKFLNRVWSLAEKVDPELEATIEDQRLIHKTIKAVGERIERMKFNTAVAAFNEMMNEIGNRPALPKEMIETLVILVSPFAPHMANEIWENLGHKETLTYHAWPQFDPELAKDELVTIPVQVNGKLRDTLEVEEGLAEKELFDLALASEKVQKFLGGKEPRKIINVRGKLINIVVAK